MKRCPLCDFIYEDDQNLCDMDGIQLIAGGDVNPPAASAPAAPARSSRRKRLSLLTLGLALGVALFSAFYGPQGEAALANPDAAPPPAAVRESPASPAAPPAAEPAPSNSGARGGDSGEAAADPTPRPATTTPKPRKTEARAKRSQPASGEARKDSTLGSFLKKSGRILKKPFKL